MHTASEPSRMWDNLLSFVTESVDFDLLPISASSPPAPLQQHSFSLDSQDGWSASETSSSSEEDEIDGGYRGAGGPPAPFGGFEGAGGPPAPFGGFEETDAPFVMDNWPDKAFTGGRCETDGGGEDEIDGGLEETCGEYGNGHNEDAPSFGTDGPRGPPALFYPPSSCNVPPAVAGGPPPPPPPPALAKVDPFTEAKQKINRMMFGLQEKLDNKIGSGKAEDGDLVYDALDAGVSTLTILCCITCVMLSI